MLVNAKTQKKKKKNSIDQYAYYTVCPLGITVSNHDPADSYHSKFAAVRCSKDSYCLAGLAVSVTAIAAPAVMTADMGAAVKDALALDLSMTYEELQHVSLSNSFLLFIRKVGVHT